MKKISASELRAEAQAKRDAAASQKADLRSGNFPKSINSAKLEEHIARLLREADELDAQADGRNDLK